MNMKSLCKVNSRTSQNQFQAWTPAELTIQFEDSPAEAQTERILAIFRDDVGGSVAQPGSHSALFRGARGQSFCPWQPIEMASKPAAVREADWTFFGSIETPYQNVQQPHRLEFEELGEPTLQEQQDKETSMVLEQARMQAEEIILAAQAEADNVLLQ